MSDPTETKPPEELKTCPFCGEEDFDLPGLKYHLRFYCGTFEITEDVSGLLKRRCLEGGDVE